MDERIQLFTIKVSFHPHAGSFMIISHLYGSLSLYFYWLQQWFINTDLHVFTFIFFFNKNENTRRGNLLWITLLIHPRAVSILFSWLYDVLCVLNDKAEKVSVDGFRLYDVSQNTDQGGIKCTVNGPLWQNNPRQSNVGREAYIIPYYTAYWPNNNVYITARLNSQGVH